MKIFIFSLFTLLFISISSAFAAVVVTEVGVPITVEKNVYTVTGTVPTTGTYYYSYTGYQCYVVKKKGVKFTHKLKPKVTTDKTLYCYTTP